MSKSLFVIVEHAIGREFRGHKLGRFTPNGFSLKRLAQCLEKVYQGHHHISGWE
jgi:hypothetical protein